MKAFLFSFIALAFAAFSASACEVTASGSNPVQGCPTDIMQHMDREAMCVHWAGEEPYDDERREMILKALEELHCDEPLLCDRHALLQKYKGTIESSVLAQGLRVIAGEDWAEDPFYLEVAASCGAGDKNESEE